MYFSLYNWDLDEGSRKAIPALSILIESDAVTN
jgi:hypothetical protein